MGAHPPFWPFEPAKVNPIKPVYDPDWPDGRLNLTASVFNQIGQYTSSLLVAGATQNSPFNTNRLGVGI